ncbi:g protein-coupled receptor-related [Anaeramoeba flamelloides]|uniref:G protein-coupled receptor-related n=1 Tax=Anaeramoeba flamelloides TaxID=1746091 RepID=A0ABQ8YYU2_9EUKA|nr:g protein-coupled receptor-related [Anaeramoeba flamelloides]
MGTHGAKDGGVSIGDACTECAAGSFQDTLGQIECISCEIGRYQDEKGKSHCKLCPSGTYQEDQGADQCKGYPVGTYNTKTGSTTNATCTKCDKGTFNDLEAQASCALCPMRTYQDSKGQSKCLECQAGSYTDREAQTICQLCKSGTYQDATGSTNCNSCPFDKWQSNIGSTEYSGYWSSQANPIALIKCKIKKACPGYEIEKCNDLIGYKGFECTECLRGFYKMEYRCDRFSDNANVRLAFLLFAFLICLLVFSFFAKKATAYFGSFTISFSFFQILVIMYQLGVRWPTNLSSMFKLFLPLNFNLDFLATECTFNLTHLEKWYLIQLSPIIFFFLFLIIYFLLLVHSKVILKYNLNVFAENYITRKCPKFFYKPSKQIDNTFLYYLHFVKFKLLSPLFQGLTKEELNDMKCIFTNVYLTLLTLLYLILSQKCLQVFDCKYDSSSKNYIFQPEPNYNCFEKWWYQKLFIASIIFIIFYIIGIPFLILYLLIKNSKILTETQFDLKFGLLCTRYNKNFFFWEIIIMIRKLFLIIMTLFISNFPTFQLILIVLVLLVALVIQQIYKPYLSNRHNYLESTLLLISIIILLSGLIFNSKEFIYNDKESRLLSKIIIVIMVLSITFLLIINVADIVFRIKHNKNNKNHFKTKNQSEKSFLNSLLQKNKKDTFLLFLSWLSILNNSQLKKLNFIFIKIQKKLFDSLPENNFKGDSVAILQKSQRLKKQNKKFTKKNVNREFNKIILQHVLVLFIKWYKLKSTWIQKVRIFNLFSLFFHYKTTKKNINSKIME